MPFPDWFPASSTSRQTVRVLSGVDIGAPHRFLCETAALLATGPLDRVIGSIHQVMERGELVYAAEKQTQRLGRQNGRQEMLSSAGKGTKLQCFVAMAFGRPDTDRWYDSTLKPLLIKHGLAPRRVDRITHNDNVDQRILKELGKADLVVADLTYARPSVYFEAGHAHGRELPVIYTARWDHLKPSADDLDSLKQQGFYVDFVSGRPQSPDEFAGGLGELIGYLFAVAEERCDSLAQFHLTPERSAWFLSQVRTRKGGWPPPVGSANELSGIVLSLASHFSAAETLDYTGFRATCELAPEISGDARRRAVGSVMTILAERLEKTDALLEANLRAVQMLKLVSSYMECLGDSDPTMENQPREP